MWNFLCRSESTENRYKLKGEWWLKKASFPFRESSVTVFYHILGKWSKLYWIMICLRVMIVASSDFLCNDRSHLKLFLQWSIMLVSIPFSLKVPFSMPVKKVSSKNDCIMEIGEEMLNFLLLMLLCSRAEDIWIAVNMQF